MISIKNSPRQMKKVNESTRYLAKPSSTMI